MFTNEASVEIYSSREKIRNQLTEYVKKYLGLENVDLYKTSFVSYIIDMLSILSTNQLFYSSTVYKEQFFLQAQLIESVYNLAQWIGYNPKGATPAQVQALFTIPLGFQDQEISITIPEGFTIKAGEIVFQINSNFSLNANISDVLTEIKDMNQKGITVEILQNRIVTVKDSNGFSYPVQLSVTGENTSEAQFLLPFTQITTSFSVTQIPDDLRFYQFFSYKFTDISGQISNQDVYVVPPDVVLPPGISITDIDSIEAFNKYLTPEQQAEYKWTLSEAGIYTLTSTDKQYVFTSYDNQADIIFGNGVLGKQPTPGSVVFVIFYLTNGESGNVIPGSITTGDPILYTNSQGNVSRISYTVINTSSATGGKDSQSIEEIKNSALVNLTSQKRLVSNQDYDNISSIVQNVPLLDSIPILKRSDLKVNEVTIFSELIQDDSSGISQIIPTRNVIMVPDSTSVIYPEFYIPRGTIPQNPLDLTISEFQTIFSMNVNLLTNSVGYEYLLKSTSISSILQSTDEVYNSKVYISIPNVSFSATVNPSDPDPVTISVNAVVNHITTAGIQQFRCKIKTLYNGEINLMSTDLDPNDPLIVKGFSYNYLNILSFPLGTTSFEFEIQGYIPYDLVTETDKIALGWGPGEAITKPSAWLTISVYACSLVIRQDLSEFMISSVDSYTDEESVIKYRIHDVPVILNEYVNLPTFDSNNFELNVLQKLINNMQISQYRMINDFINIKFPDTTGLLTNMKYNPVDAQTIISRRLTSVPVSPNLNDTYIINGSEGYDFLGNNWNNYISYIVIWNGVEWLFTAPSVNQFIEINNIYDPLDEDQGKRLIYSGSSWFEPVFNIPLNITLRITQDSTISSSTSAIVNSIKTEIVNQMASQFGLDKNIDRSQIIQIVRSVPGVKYVELLEPSVDIKFNYNILTDLTEEEVLDYTPQISAITEDTITVKVVS